MPFFTYIVRCRDDSLYTGWTDNLQKRLKAHNEGKGGHYTSSHRPVTLVYHEEHSSKTEAMQREWAIKRLTRAEKEKLLSATGKKIKAAH